MDTIQDFTLQFRRELRTISSEQYTIFYSNNDTPELDWSKIGTFHVHIANHITGILVIFEDFGIREINLIVEEIRDQLLQSLELAVKDPMGTYIEVYSNCQRVEDLDWSILSGKKLD